MQVGSIEVSPVHDGHIDLPVKLFFRNTTDEDWAPHRQFLTGKDTLRCDVGGFLVRTGDRVVLVDAGSGKPPEQRPGFGMLLESLGALGVAPAEVTDLVLTHLHFDHIGWASEEGQAVFPNATYRCHSADWDFFFDPQLPEIQTGKAMGAPLTPAERLEPVGGRFEMWDADTTLLPGIDVRVAAGHTPGSTVVVLSSGEDRAVLLGDVVHCPVELIEGEWEVVGDVDKDLARRTRQAWADELEGSAVPAAAAHFPGMRFGRLLPGEVRRQWVFD
jgi:glyoxylase-like metal-dependent hydrolase (beta-lactamase superfamily II)